MAYNSRIDICGLFIYIVAMAIILNYFRNSHARFEIDRTILAYLINPPLCF